MTAKRIVAIGLLTQRDIDVLGPTFDRLWPVDETPCFSQLLEAIDEADGRAFSGRSDTRGPPSVERGRR